MSRFGSLQPAHRCRDGAILIRTHADPDAQIGAIGAKFRIMMLIQNGTIGRTDLYNTGLSGPDDDTGRGEETAACDAPIGCGCRMIPQFSPGDKVVRGENPGCPASHDHVAFVRTGIVRPRRSRNMNEGADLKATVAGRMKCAPDLDARVCSICSKASAFSSTGIAPAFDDDKAILHERCGGDVSDVDACIPLNIWQYGISDPFGVSSFAGLGGKCCEQKQDENEQRSPHQSSL